MHGYPVMQVVQYHVPHPIQPYPHPIHGGFPAHIVSAAI